MISIIIPIFNASKYLKECFESCVAQTFENIEIIAVDDASTDNSLNMIVQLAEIDSRIKIVKHTVNCGLVQSRRTGIENAIGEYVCFLDSDDTLCHDAIETLMTKSAAHDIVIGQMSICTESGQILRVTQNSMPFGYDTHGILCAYIAKKTIGSLCGRLIKLDKLKAIPAIPTDITIGEDFIANLLLADVNCSVCLVDKPVYNYIQHPASMINMPSDNKANQRMKFIEWVVCFVTAKPDNKELTDCLALFVGEEYFSFLRDGGDNFRNIEIKNIVNNLFLSNNYALEQTPFWRKMMLQCYKLSPMFVGPLYRFLFVKIRNLLSII